MLEIWISVLMKQTWVSTASQLIRCYVNAVIYVRFPIKGCFVVMLQGSSFSAADYSSIGTGPEGWCSTVLSSQKVLSGSGRATRRCSMYFPIRRNLPARPEPDNSFWDDSTIPEQIPEIISYNAVFYFRSLPNTRCLSVLTPCGDFKSFT